LRIVSTLTSPTYQSIGDRLLLAFGIVGDGFPDDADIDEWHGDPSRSFAGRARLAERLETRFGGE
jgi:hypothetical protein